MATMPNPQSPAGLLLLAGAGLWLMSRAKPAAASTAAARPITPGKPVTLYSSPQQTAELLASRVIAMTRGLTGNAAAVQAEEDAREAARKAVRAGDEYYGAGAWAYYAANTEEARRAMGEGGWSAPLASVVPNIDTGSVGGQTDTVPAAPWFDPATADRWQLSAMAALP